MQHCNWRYIFLNPFEKGSVTRRKKAGILGAILHILHREYEIGEESLKAFKSPPSATDVIG